MLVHSRFVGDIIALAADNFSGTIQHDATMKDVLDALKNGNYKKKFKEKCPGIPVDDLSLENKASPYTFKTKSGNTHPVFGSSAFKIVLQYLDEKEKESHKGRTALRTKLEDDKIEFWSPEGVHHSHEDILETYQCDACDIVARVDPQSTSIGKVWLENDEDIKEALHYADSQHKG